MIFITLVQLKGKHKNIQAVLQKVFFRHFQTSEKNFNLEIWIIVTIKQRPVYQNF